jgi:phosphotransferase system HPr-like phosphotransfer protein
MKKSLTEVITEDDFLKLAQEHSQNFFKIFSLLHGAHRPSSRRFYAHLIEESEELESFLDDHCARDNKTWYFFCELVACIRNLGKVAFILKHILNRYPAHNLNDDEPERFLTDAQSVSVFLDKTILSLYKEVKKEALLLGIKFPEETLKEDLFREIYPQKRLPYTIDEEKALGGRKVAAKIAAQYLRVIEKFNSLGWSGEKANLDDLTNMIPNKVNEESSREILALIHNLQSIYDHYIKHTPLESQGEVLKRLRGHISMPLHLLSIVNWLSHLYQRHVHTAGRSKAGQEISAIIDEARILDIIMNFALFYASRYLKRGKNLAKEILGKYIEIDTCELKVPEKFGFHLRPANLVARIAAYYGTRLSLILDGQEYDASKILSITMAAGLIARKGYKTVLFKGDKRVLKDLKLLAEYNYGQDERGNQAALPPELSYLWV